MKSKLLGKKLCIACFLTAMFAAPGCAAPQTDVKAEQTPPVPLARTSSAQIQTTNSTTENTQLDSFSGSQTMQFDVDLKNSTSDTFTVTGNIADGSTAVVQAINVYTDSEKPVETIVLFTDGKSPNIDLSNYAQFTNNSKYIITQSTTTPGVLEIIRKDLSGSLNAAIADTSANKAFNAYGNTNLNADAALTTGSLTAYGNGFDLDVDGHTITVSTGTQTELNGFGSVKNYDQKGFLTNDGTTIVKDTTFNDPKTLNSTVITNNGNAHLNNVRFENQTIGAGGLVSTADGAATKVSHSHFTNIQEAAGDTILSFSNLLQTSGSGFLSIDDTTFDNIQSTNADSAISAADTSTLNITNSTFNNTNYGADALITLKNNAQGTIYNTTFNETNGINVSDAASLIFSDSSITNSDESPFYVEGGDVMITRSEISGSSSHAINVQGGSVTVADSTIQNNTDTSAAAIRVGTGHDLTVYNSKFINNKVSSSLNADGAAIYSNGTTSIVNSYFEGNGSTTSNGSDSGGAIENNRNGGYLTITGSDFVSNSTGMGRHTFS